MQNNAELCVRTVYHTFICILQVWSSVYSSGTFLCSPPIRLLLKMTKLPNDSIQKNLNKFVNAYKNEVETETTT